MVAYTYMNKQQELEAAKEKLMQELPEFSLAFAREKLFYLKRQEQIDFYITGIEMAGIPES